MNAPTGPDPILEALQARLGTQYAFEGVLGRGGMGAVYRARDLTLDRPVAIKVVLGDVATNPDLKARFLQEARTVAKLRHPNIVAVYTAGDAGGLLYFVMELVPGESLRDLLTREGRVGAVAGERILHELALALDYAHANGIVHRDVKPENILLDRETGRAMLTDFGVARALEGDGRMTGTGMILGSPRYMSPEQATGEQTIDGRSDLYALALVGYEMFSGKPVVDAGNVAAMLVKHLTETPQPISQAVPAIPEGVAVAIDRALAKDRAARWASGREMADVIGMGWTPQGGTTGARAAAPTGWGLPATKAGRFRAYVVVAASVLAFAITGVVLLVGRGGRPPRGVDPRRSYAVMPFEVQSGNREVAWLRDGAVNMLTLALSQWRDLTVADYERTMVLVRDAGLEDKRVDLDRALEIARRAGAWTVVTGTITTAGDSLRVDARLYDVASGKPLLTETRAGRLADDPRPLFDGLARYLLGVAGGAATGSVELAAATTSSITAYRAYLEGTRALFGWRMREADSLFQRAIAADSSFALAWHKRALAIGWADAAGPVYLAVTARADELADRLPPREQALVRGHGALAAGLTAQMGGKDGRTELRRAQAIYRELIARDTAVAEAWYGLGDALFHEQFQRDSIAESTARITGALRAFHHTLALDSTFHLAYSHLIQLYQQLASANTGLVLDGDSVGVLTDSASLRRFGGRAGLTERSRRAARIGLDLARGWARADENAITPNTQLVTGFIAAGEADSAGAAIERALTRPAFQGPERPFWAGVYRTLIDDPRGVPELMAAVRAARPETIRRFPLTDRFGWLAVGLDAAAASGSGEAIDRVAALWMATDSSGANGVSSRQLLDLVVPALRGTVRGSLTPDERRALLAGIRPSLAAPPNDPIRFGSSPLAYAGYFVTRDTVFSGLVRGLVPQQPYPEIDAAEALARGDTAKARAIAAGFSPADSVRVARLGMAGMRTALRAEVLAALGDTRGAIAQYEAIHPVRFSTALVDPGFAVYVRTFAARARLHEQLGERDKAIAAWEEFARRWQDGDALSDAPRREARAALQRLKDQPATPRP